MGGKVTRPVSGSNVTSTIGKGDLTRMALRRDLLPCDWRDVGRASPGGQYPLDLWAACYHSHRSRASGSRGPKWGSGPPTSKAPISGSWCFGPLAQGRQILGVDEEPIAALAGDLARNPELREKLHCGRGCRVRKPSAAADLG